MRYRIQTTLLLLGALAVFALAPPAAAQDTPSQLDLVLANLSQRLRTNIAVENLTAYEWYETEFADASLGCPQSGQAYAQVVTPGYQFLLTYDETVYDYRVAQDGDQVLLCDTRPAIPADATPPADSPDAPCGDQVVVERGDRLIEIARECNTTVAAILAANPDIEDPSLIYPDQTIALPDGSGSQRAVSIRPDSGPAGSTVRLFASGFPPGAQVKIGVGPPASEYVVVATREIGADRELEASLRISPEIQAPDERVFVVELNGEKTVSEVFTVTEQAAGPQPTPTHYLFERTQIFLVALGDAGRSGQEIGCGDSLVPVTVTFDPTVAPLTAALEEMFAITSRTYGQSGLYNALYQSDLRVEGIDIEAREAIISLTGELRAGGVCDTPRITAQIEQTALQYSTIDQVSIFLNGQPLSDAF